MERSTFSLDNNITSFPICQRTDNCIISLTNFFLGGYWLPARIMQSRPVHAQAHTPASEWMAEESLRWAQKPFYTLNNIIAMELRDWDIQLDHHHYQGPYDLLPFDLAWFICCCSSAAAFCPVHSTRIYSFIYSIQEPSSSLLRGTKVHGQTTAEFNI